jgi:hypothetical protein
MNNCIGFKSVNHFIKGVETPLIRAHAGTGNFQVSLCEGRYRITGILVNMYRISFHSTACFHGHHRSPGPSLRHAPGRLRKGRWDVPKMMDIGNNVAMQNLIQVVPIVPEVLFLKTMANFSPCLNLMPPNKCSAIRFQLLSAYLIKEDTFLQDGQSKVPLKSCR